MLKCKEVQEQMSLYIDKQLSHQELLDFEKHIHCCKQCREELELLETIVKSTHSIDEVELPEEFRQQLHQKLEQAHRDNKHINHPPWYLNWRTYSGLAAGLILFTILRFQIFGPLDKIQNAYINDTNLEYSDQIMMSEGMPDNKQDLQEKEFVEEAIENNMSAHQESFVYDKDISEEKHSEPILKKSESNKNSNITEVEKTQVAIAEKQEALTKEKAIESEEDNIPSIAAFYSPEDGAKTFDNSDDKLPDMSRKERASTDEFGGNDDKTNKDELEGSEQVQIALRSATGGANQSDALEEFTEENSEQNYLMSSLASVEDTSSITEEERIIKYKIVITTNKRDADTLIDYTKEKITDFNGWYQEEKEDILFIISNDQLGDFLESINQVNVDYSISYEEEDKTFQYQDLIKEREQITSEITQLNEQIVVEKDSKNLSILKQKLSELQEKQAQINEQIVSLEQSKDLYQIKIINITAPNG